MQYTHESLATIPNRYAFLDNIEKLLVADSHQSLFLIDVVRFSDVSSSLGYDFGDKILLEIANRIIYIADNKAVFGRISGDIFGLVLSGTQNQAQLHEFYSHLISHFKTPIQCDDHAFIVDFNVGVASNPLRNKNINSLFSLAEMALRQAKSNKFDNFQYANEINNSEGGRSLTLKADLTRALAQNELEIYLQPVIDLNSLEILGAECLLRWNHPLDGVLFPGALIEAAESYNMMNEVGYWVLNAAFEHAAKLNRVGLQLKISVNMSPTQLYDLDFVKSLREMSVRHGVKMCQFELELTEDVALSNSLLVKKQLSQIRSLGVSVAIDDFGKGYSNLGYLRNIDIDTIKIDKSFIMEINQSPINKAIVEASLLIAKAAKCGLVAEGIEDISHLHILREIGIQKGQGYLFSKAICLDDFIDLAYKDMSVGTSMIRAMNS
ncbi:bifunctional diguanylate cyclase/phosphodiesterase [Paraglaciecola aquimarina]|uniref:Bifunctional diguanylate cyclase/phosphodiesterase n=1 Tax=Paraglaciecola aquimarina TaxID=1235557 RepID=A0ABU3SZK6_9ALTE|nr:bifunctional diguanylate cyclase/phosphodiesterase [Paraglaciecola aquimarina]MDU0355447.1 bifunctional diguanylate cyclase/phosphodiesterase [Paraglaciecola aquimarina]